MSTETNVIQQLSVGPDLAGKMTGLTRSAIYIAIANGDLKSFKYGKRRLILTAELKCWVNNIAKNGER